MPYRHKIKADRIINHFDRVMKKNELDYFVVAGTCLGMIRDGGYIEGDDDIDIAVIYTSQDEINEIKAILQSNGFEIRRENYSKNKSIIKKYGQVPNSIHFFIYNVLIDLLIMYEVDNKYYLADKWKFDCSLFDNSGFIEYNRMILRVPRNVEKVLEMMYSDWKTPTNNHSNRGWRIMK